LQVVDGGYLINWDGKFWILDEYRPVLGFRSLGFLEKDYPVVSEDEERKYCDELGRNIWSIDAMCNKNTEEEWVVEGWSRGHNLERVKLWDRNVWDVEVGKWSSLLSLCNLDAEPLLFF
jgi:hypothetical protein